MKKIMSLLLALVLVFSLVACGTNEQPKETSAKETAAATETQAAAPAETQGAESTVNEYGYNVTWEDTADVVVLMPSMGPVPTGLQAVEDELNKLTEEQINTHVTLKIVEVGGYDQQVGLITASNEQVDLMVTMPNGPASLSTMASQNQLNDITDLLSEYAPRALEVVGDLINGTQINGRTYAFTAYKGFAGGEYICMRTDVLEDLGLMDKALNMTTFAEYEEILEAVKNSEKWGYLSGIVAANGHGTVLPDNSNVGYAENFADCTFMDNLANTQGVIAVRFDGTEVLNVFETDEYKYGVEIVNRWYEKGYIYKDAATTQENGQELVKSNIAFSYINYIERGSEESVDTNCAMDMTTVMVCQKPISTASLTKFAWAVPTCAKEIEPALTLLEMFCVDETAANLIAWGVEGVDYERDANGVAQYIAGNESPAYHGVAFLNPNKFLVYPWGTEPADINDMYMQYMEESLYSPFLGFSCDTADLVNEVAAVTNVTEEYLPQILSGMADAETYQAFLDKLDASGIDAIIDLYQTELDAWLSVAK